MLCSQRLICQKSNTTIYKALQNARILNLPLYNCGSQPSFIPSTSYGSNPCDPCATSSSSDKRSKLSVVYKMFVPKVYKDHDYKNMTIGRPMSPHLTVYAPTITAVTSITQRISGLTTAAMALMLSGGTLFFSDGIETYVTMLQSMEISHFKAFVLKFIIGLPFAYHYFNGIRFCFWNAGYLLSLDKVYGSAKKAIIAGVIGAIIFAMF